MNCQLTQNCIYYKVEPIYFKTYSYINKNSYDKYVTILNLIFDDKIKEKLYLIPISF